MKRLFARGVRLIVLEVQLWTSLGTWLVRRRRPDGQMFTYHKQSIFGIFLIAALFSSPVEILLFELLIPWAWLRWASSRSCRRQRWLRLVATSAPSSISSWCS